jgi:hypothetical protein
MKDLFGLHKFLDWRGRTLSSRRQANTESKLRLRVPPSEKANHSNPIIPVESPFRFESFPRRLSSRGPSCCLYEHFMNPLFDLFVLLCPTVRGGQEVGPKTLQVHGDNSMWIHEVAPERLAELFHHYHQALTLEIGGKGSEGRGTWQEVPQQEKSRLVTAARLALLELESMTRDRAQSRQYFTQPGEAEWGC